MRLKIKKLTNKIKWKSDAVFYKLFIYDSTLGIFENELIKTQRFPLVLNSRYSNLEEFKVSAGKLIADEFNAA